uniref:Putative reverse transcriptase n=1 Tax=Weissia controversa var. wimmeriana TaxID=263895 RepID=Q6QNF6_9BRYO|nr:putative reverse transcriptase [Weissia controversa var. wimmeriana]
MVLVKKKNGKLRMCIDYQKLNKNTQKDHFPLTFVNTILEEVLGHELYTFMDGYLGYNQITIAPDNYHKTAFTTP